MVVTRYAARDPHPCVAWKAQEDAQSVSFFIGNTLIFSMPAGQITGRQIQWMVDSFNYADSRPLSGPTYPDPKVARGNMTKYDRLARGDK